MNLIISLDGNQITLMLKDGRKTVDEFSWHGEHSLSAQLLPSIDKLLEKNKVGKEDVGRISTRISKVSGVTSSRIIQATAKAWNAATDSAKEGR